MTNSETLTQRHEGTKKKQTQEKQKAEERLSVNPEFIGQASALYNKGLSLPGVASALKPEWPTVNLRTLQRVAKEHGWEQSRAVYQQMHKDAQASAEGIIPEVVLNLQKIRSQMEARVLIKPADIFAYRALVEDLMWYTGKHPKLKDATPLAVSGDVEVAALLEAIAEDDVVGGAWKRRRSHIEKAYRGKLDAAATLTQRREGTKKSRSKKSGEAKV